MTSSFSRRTASRKEMGTAEDIGNAAAALSGGAFDYSAGQVINVDGGFHIRRL